MPVIEEPVSAAQGFSEASNDSGEDEFGATIQRLRAEIEQTFNSLRRFLYVERRALELAVFDSALRALAYVTFGVTALILTVTAALLAVVGARRGLEIWTGGAWWSDVLLATAIVALLAASAHFIRRAVHRSVLRRTQRTLAGKSGASERSESRT